MLTAKAWKDLVRVNNWVNDTIKPVTDLEHWGVVERWSYPDDGYGDCEDYVLLKRRMLIQAGWPREALLITVVRDKKGDGHAVLTVKTDKGDFILDNQDEDVLLWSDTGYRFVKRQSQTDPNIWVSLGDPRPRPPPSSATAQVYASGRVHCHEQEFAPRSRPHPSPSPDRVRARPASPKAGRTFLRGAIARVTRSASSPSRIAASAAHRCRRRRGSSRRLVVERADDARRRADDQRIVRETSCPR